MPSDNLNQLVNTFCQNFDCKVTQSGTRSIRTLPFQSVSDWSLDTIPYNIESERVYKIEIPESEMRHMMTKLLEIDRHEQIQQRYPQLKLAYMDYLTQVHLTVDNPHNY